MAYGVQCTTLQFRSFGPEEITAKDHAVGPKIPLNAFLLSEKRKGEQERAWVDFIRAENFKILTKSIRKKKNI